MARPPRSRRVRATPVERPVDAALEVDAAIVTSSTLPHVEQIRWWWCSVSSSASSYRAKSSLGDDAADDAGLLEDREVPVDRALRKSGAGRRRDRRIDDGLPGTSQRLDRALAASACIAARRRGAASRPSRARSLGIGRHRRPSSPSSRPRERALAPGRTATTANAAAATRTIVPPGASPQIIERGEADDRPSRTPIADRHRSVARNDRASSWPLATGSTIIAATSRMPTIRIAATTATAVSTASSDVHERRRADRRRATIPRPSRPRTGRGGSTTSRDDRNAPSATITAISAGVTGERLPEQVRRARSRPGPPPTLDEHHAERDARVEEDRERQSPDARRRAAATPRRGRRPRRTPSAVHRSGQMPASSPAPTPGERDVPIPSPISDMPLLHEERADHRRERCRRRCPATSARCMNPSSNGIRRAPRRARAIIAAPPARAAGPRRARRGSRPTRRARDGGPSNRTVPFSTTTRSTSWATAESSCETSRTPAPCSRIRCTSDRGTGAATPRRRRRSARRAPAVPARSRTPGR